MTATVLIADDQQDVREALGLLIGSDASLELIGLAADADEAIELAELHQPDVALLDVKMPKGGGPRAASEIAARSPSTKVVALSAYEDRGSVFQMLRAGAVAYLVKGASADDILDTIERTLRGEAVLAPEVTSEVLNAFAGHLERERVTTESYRATAARVRGALERSEVTTVYQPIVRLSSREIAGYEALSRFVGDPPRPVHWFADAAQVGLAVELESAALRSALSRMSELPRDAFLTVNVNPRELVSDAVLELLAGAPAGRLVVEVTEHAEIRDYEALTRALTDFRGRGGRLAVDDAGAGFASLRHVLMLSPDMIKIDGSLISELESTSAARALTASIAAFAHEMALAVIAEGIEGEDTIDLLLALGVEYGQGYHLGRPEPLA